MLTPYLYFNGQASAAIDFYEQAFGGADKEIMRYAELPPDPAFPIAAEQHDWVGHGGMMIRGAQFYFCDMPDKVTPGGPVTLMFDFDTPEEVSEAYQRLMPGGQSLMEPAPQFYAKMFASVQDKFGVVWQLICE